MISHPYQDMLLYLIMFIYLLHIVHSRTELNLYYHPLLVNMQLTFSFFLCFQLKLVLLFIYLFNVFIGV